MEKIEVSPTEKKIIERRRAEMAKHSRLGSDIAKKMEYIAETFREDPTRVRYIKGAAGTDAELNPLVLHLVIDQVYNLCHDIREGRFKTE